MTDNMGFSNEPKLPGEKRTRGSRKQRGPEGTEPPPIIPSVRPATPGPADPSTGPSGPPLAAPPGSSPEAPPAPPFPPKDQPQASGPMEIAEWFRHVGLFLGIAGLPIYAAIWGIQTLVAARRGASVNVKGAIVAVTATGLLALGVVISIIVVALQPGETRDVSDLAIGDCLMPKNLTEDAPEELSSLRVIDCEEPHFGQVFYTGALPAGVYPGHASIIETLDQVCGAQAYRVTLGPNDPDGYMQYLLPTEEGWGLGNRKYTCLVVAQGEDRFVGSAVSP